MLTWDELRGRRDIIAAIDWQMTPQEAFESYQLKGREGWRARSLPQVYFFYLSVWRGQAKVLLVRRAIKDSEEIAEAPVPADLRAALAARAEGEQMPRGQIALDQAIRDWLRAELGV